ncbi:S9 family peptidase [Rhodoblastus sphagnicola]|uniref:S9 family peptidase n=1 Tax=Rhodoblastus sphagnicola TaxID=333368 RepID=A0A2S6N6M1_9HYPH|nr:S9 family peptidase [Rhodoblastus sphagnicola]MBB4197634.1 oligopeptidase B [Rhodoblastus sphagnicola]PPQ30258.1 S9 family peptidase [Rhodoblastus sphagnicola]
MPSFAKSRDITPPHLEKRPAAQVFHGVTLKDDYAWLRADNWREALQDPDVLPAEIRAALEAENAYAQATLKPLAPLAESLEQELVGRVDETESDPPARDGDWFYFTRFRENGQHPLVCRRSANGQETGQDGAEEIVLLDGDLCAEGLDYFSLGEALHSPDHRWLAWSRDERGSELQKISCRDLTTGVDGEDVVENTDGAIVWTCNSRGFLYTRIDDDFRTCAVYLHRIGEDPARDTLLFEEKNPALFIHLRGARSRRHAIVNVSDHDCSESWLIDLAHPTAPPRLVSPRRPGLIYDVEPSLTRLYMRTNADGAFDFKIVSIGLDQLEGGTPDSGHWREEAPHRPGKVIFNAAIFADHLVWLERENCRPRLVAKRCVNTGGQDEPFTLAFEAPVLHLRLERNFDFFDPIVRVTFSTPIDPDQTFDIDLRNRERTLVKTKRIPSGHDPSLYATRLDWVEAGDGARVPLTLIWRKDRAEKPGPLLLYGYGAYGVALPTRFDENLFSLIDRGFVYAIAHVRGGGELGERWKQAGKMAAKPNTFSDFIACARHLCALGLTEPGKIVAEGGSAGGMLMGAVANLAPELFGGIIAEVPFVDVLNTICDESLPLTPPEWLEWGDPLRDHAVFDLIRAYSPYDNVRAQAYPAMLIEAGLTDPRVTYWEPAKWAQKLREKMTGGGPILLKTNMEAGHGGAAGRFDELEDVAWRFAFAIEAVN